eukprot:Hpha_TRINITY_DN33742_c0_g1::TRINITY_DN33742_c0_g1_i1::g.25019::m.25019
MGRKKSEPEEAVRPAVSPPTRSVWEVYVVDLTSGSEREPTTLQCSSSDTVSNLRRKLSEAWEVPTTSIRLFLKGQELTIYDEAAVLLNMGVRDGTTLDAVEILPPPPRTQGWFANWFGRVLPSIAPCCSNESEQREQEKRRQWRASHPPRRDSQGGSEERAPLWEEAPRDEHGRRVDPQYDAPIDGVMQAIGPSNWPCSNACAPVILPPLGREKSGAIVVALVAAYLARTPAILRDMRQPNKTAARLQAQSDWGHAAGGARRPGYMMGQQPGGVSLDVGANRGREGSLGR